MARKRGRNRAPKFDSGKVYGSELTSADAITTRLREGYEPGYYDSLHQQTKYAFGEPWKAETISGGIAGGGDFPDFPDIRPRLGELGRSKRILNASFVNLSRTFGMDPQPEFPQVDKRIGEIRKQFWLKRYNDLGWRQEL